METMTHRERVLASFNHQQPDRVPMDMMGNETMLLDQTYIRLRDYLGLTPIPPVRSGSNANYYDERILEILDVDFRRIFLKKGPATKTTYSEDSTFTDIWGIRYRQDGIFVNALTHPLADAASLQDVKAYTWPKAEEMFSAEGLAEQARQMYHKTDYALVARNPLTFGFLDRACALCGMANFMMLMASSPDVAKAIISHELQIALDTYRMFLDAVGPYVQMVEVGDDLGSQQNLLISPAMYRRFIKPAEKALYDLFHAKAPGAALMRHTDGNIFKIIPDLIEVGVNVLNPVQTSAKDMEGKRLKELFGDKLVFHGSLEMMEGTKEEAVAEVKERIDTFAQGGGFVLASCNHMIDVSPKNILAIFETAREYSAGLVGGIAA
jgi:uroporphyrinogen decarboxylase